MKFVRYFHYAVFPELVENKDKVSEKIIEFWESINHLIRHESYVVDFAIMKNGAVKVIEINPFVWLLIPCTHDLAL